MPDLNSKAPPHFTGLDALRFFAAFLVLLSHVRTAVFVEFSGLDGTSGNPLAYVFFLALRLGNEGVIAFFVLSGFLVGGKAIERILGNQFEPVQYAIDRTVRIALPLVPAIILSMIATNLCGGSINVTQVLGNIFALQGVLVAPLEINAPLWSLSYEIWFYALVFGVGLARTKGHWCVTSIGILLIGAAIFTQLQAMYLFCWLFGAAGFFLRPQKMQLSMLIMAAAIAGVAILGIQMKTGNLANASLAHWFPSMEVSRLILAFAVVICIRQVSLYPEKTKLAHYFGRVSKWLAGFSYTLYLVHFPLIEIMRHFGLAQQKTFGLQSIGLFCIVCCACIAAAYVIYLISEKQTDHVKRMIRRIPILNRDATFSAIPSKAVLRAENKPPVCAEGDS